MLDVVRKVEMTTHNNRGRANCSSSARAINRKGDKFSNLKRIVHLDWLGIGRKVAVTATTEQQSDQEQSQDGAHRQQSSKESHKQQLGSSVEACIAATRNSLKRHQGWTTTTSKVTLKFTSGMYGPILKSIGLCKPCRFNLMQRK